MSSAEKSFRKPQSRPATVRQPVPGCSRAGPRVLPRRTGKDDRPVDPLARKCVARTARPDAPVKPLEPAGGITFLRLRQVLSIYVRGRRGILMKTPRPALSRVLAPLPAPMRNSPRVARTNHNAAPRLCRVVQQVLGERGVDLMGNFIQDRQVRVATVRPVPIRRHNLAHPARPPPVGDPLRLDLNQTGKGPQGGQNAPGTLCQFFRLLKIDSAGHNLCRPRAKCHQPNHG